MKKIAIIGCPGSGKTTFARKLAQVTQLPLIHLDAFYHQAIWSDDPVQKKKQWAQYQLKLIQKEAWIIDGDYKSTMDIRLEAADTIIFLDYPRWISLVRAFKRQWQFRKKQRPDMPATWKEKISWQLLKTIWHYPKEQRLKTLSSLKKYKEQKSVYVLLNSKEANDFLLQKA